MVDKIQHEQVSKMLRRLSDREIDNIGSLISKKLRNRDADFLNNVVCVDLDYVSEPYEYRGPGIFEPIPKLNRIEQVLKTRGKGHHVAFVSSRFKYEGGEEAVKKWLLSKCNVPEQAVEEFFFTSCLVNGSPFVTERKVLPDLSKI